MRHGVRTVGSFLAGGTLRGRAFTVNGRPVYVEGGNWITTDLLLRYADDASRYVAEVGRYKEMGLNLIRVWGGGLWEREAFFDACDAAGMLVLQEYWMTGDNNGRWAGNYEWPLDHAAYLTNAADAFRAVRHHPSLLIVCGGNELSPKGLNPPPAVLAGLEHIVLGGTGGGSNGTAAGANGVLFVASSMAPQNYTQPFDWSYALAPNDGNYGLNLPEQFYDERNPGLTLVFPTNLSDPTDSDNITSQDVAIAFQPEIGSVSAPLSLRGLRRMLSPASAEAFPSELSATVNSNWTFHKYEAWSTTAATASKFDQVYAYFGNSSSNSDGDGGNDSNVLSSTSDWLAAANLVQAQQCQALFEGFALHMWGWYSGVLYWKASTPWPALRGALYESNSGSSDGSDGSDEEFGSLTPTAGYWGVRRAIVGLGPAWFNSSEGQLPTKGEEGGGEEEEEEATRTRTRTSNSSSGRSGDVGGLHVQLNLASLQCAVVHRSTASSSSSFGDLVATLEFVDLNGNVVATQSRQVNSTMHTTPPPAPPSSASSSSSPLPSSLSGSSGSGVALCEGAPFEWPADASSSSSQSSSSTLLLFLTLRGSNNAEGKEEEEEEQQLLSRNFYWLSSASRAAALEAASSSSSSVSSSSSSSSFPAPDYSALGFLRTSVPWVRLAVDCSAVMVVEEGGGSGGTGARSSVAVTVTHPEGPEGASSSGGSSGGSPVALWVTLTLLQQGGSLRSAVNNNNNDDAGLVLPSVHWDDNCFALLPGESRSLRASWVGTAQQQKHLRLEVSGWNVVVDEVEITSAR